MGGVSDKWSLRYVVGPRSIQMNTVMRSVVLSARLEKRAQRTHLLQEDQEENCMLNRLATSTSPACHESQQ